MFAGHVDDGVNDSEYFSPRLVVLVNTSNDNSACAVVGDPDTQQTMFQYDNKVGGAFAMLSRYHLFHGPGSCNEGMRVAYIFTGPRTMAEMNSLFDFVQDLLDRVGTRFNSNVHADLIRLSDDNAVEFYLASITVQLNVLENMEDKELFDNNMKRVALMVDVINNKSASKAGVSSPACNRFI